jgi:hypothetical protein
MIRFLNRPYQSLLLPVFALLVGTTSCTKNSDVTNANTGTVPNTVASNASVLVNTDKSQLNSLFAPFRSTPQSLTVPAGVQTVILGTKGTKLTFYPFSFLDAGGVPIASGNIDLKLIEMCTPGVMIANRTVTEMYGVPLKSGGQIYLEASQGGVPVYPGKFGVGFVQTDSSTQPMELYYGNPLNPDSVVTFAGPSSGTGTMATATTFDVTSVFNGVGGSYTYVYYNHFLFDSASSFGWIGSNHVTTLTAPITYVDVVVPDTGYNPSNTQVFLVFPSTNTVTIWNGYSPTDHKFTNAIPLSTGADFKVVIMCSRSGRYFYYEMPFVAKNNNMTITANPTPQSQAYIQSKLNAL